MLLPLPHGRQLARNLEKARQLPPLTSPMKSPTETGTTSNIRLRSKYRNWLLIFGLLLAIMQLHWLHGKENKISKTTQNLWQTISVLEAQMPMTKTKVEDILDIELKEIERNEYFLQFGANGPVLADGLSVTNVHLTLHPSMEFDDSSALAIEVNSACVTLNQVRQVFSNLEVSQSPRGHSLQETTVWSTKREWGTLSFAFREDRPDCLFRVSFRR
jgi:hypothetical protein